MDSFDALMQSAQHSAQNGVSFEDALNALLEDGPMSNAEQPAEAAENQDVPQDTEQKNVAVAKLATLEHLMMAMRAVIPKKLKATLMRDGWTETGVGLYPYEYRYESTVFTQNKRADMYIAVESAAAAGRAGIYAVTDSQNGYVRINAHEIPDDDLNVTFVLSVTI